MNKVENLKELKEMLEQGLISQDEFTKLREEVLAEVTPYKPTGLASVPLAPSASQTTIRNPSTGETVTIDKWWVFWLTFFFGFFYMAYKQVWLQAGIAVVLAFLTWGISWFIYLFLMYGLLVDTYRRNGWVIIPNQPQGAPASQPSGQWLFGTRETRPWSRSP